MHEIEIHAVQTGQQGFRAGAADAVPAHVRHADAGRVRHPAHAARDESEAVDIGFFRMLEQDLHAKADAEYRLAQ